MGMRGPAPKSAETRVFEGQRAHRPLPAPKLRYATGALERPKMSAAARRIWDGYVDQLAGSLRPVDRFALSMLCEDVALLLELQAGLRKKVGELRRAARDKGERLSGGAMLSFNETQECRRVMATINSLKGRIQSQQLQFGLTPVSALRLEEFGGAAIAPAEDQSIEAALCG